MCSHRDFHQRDLKGLLPKGHRPPPKVFKVNRITNNQLPQDNVLEVYSDGSKDGGRTGYGWCITLGNEVLHEQGRPLDPYSSVFMAEMVAIIDSLTKLEDWLDGMDEVGATVWTDSRSSIDAIYTPIITQTLALEANNIIQRLQEKGHPISLRWIPGHMDHTGNEFADFLAKSGRDKPLDVPSPALYTPPGYINGKIKGLYYGLWLREWQTYRELYGHSRRMLPKPNPVELVPVGKPPIQLTGKEISFLGEVIMGHALLGKHLSQWHRRLLHTCRLCGKAKETYYHLVFKCESLTYARFNQPCDPWGACVDYYRDLLRFTANPRIHSLRRGDIT